VGRIAAFFGLDAGGGWLARAAGLVHSTPVSRFAQLTDRERAALETASRPGMIQLGRA